MHTKTLFKFAYIITLCAFLFPACQQEDPGGALTADPRGKIVSQELSGTYSAEQVDSIVISLGQPELLLLPRNYDVSIYNIIYETIDPKGEPTVASGALVIPDIDVPKAWISYQHGTVIKKDDVPSRGSQELLIGIIYSANTGAITSMPDYLGLGDGPGMHPYVHGKSQATAAIDMIRAGKRICSDMDIPVNDKLLIFGYSQGGHATMALHKEIEENYTNEFTITASAPMAGPYDISGYQAATFEDELTYSVPYYLPYLLLGYNEAYDLYDSPSDFFESPYDELLPPLFDGLSGGGAINAVMPDIPSHIVKADVFEDFKYNYNHPFRVALEKNDLWDWKPEAPMHICHCTGDTQVFYENSLVAYNSFRDKGKEDVTLVTPNDGDHGDCVLPCFIDALIWFGEFYE